MDIDIKQCPTLQFDGSKLRALRKKLGLKPFDLTLLTYHEASNTAIRPEMITKYESERVTPGVPYFFRLVHALGCSPYDLLSPIDHK